MHSVQKEGSKHGWKTLVTFLSIVVTIFERASLQTSIYEYVRYRCTHPLQRCLLQRTFRLKVEMLKVRKQDVHYFVQFLDVAWWCLRKLYVVSNVTRCVGILQELLILVADGTFYKYLAENPFKKCTPYTVGHFLVILVSCRHITDIRISRFWRNIVVGPLL